MNEQDQKSLYTAFVLLGLLTRGHPLSGVVDVTHNIVNAIMAPRVNENDSQ